MPQQQPLLLATLLAALLPCGAARAAAGAGNASFAWIAAIESGPQDTSHRLLPQTYYIDRQYLLPNGTQLVGAAGTRIVAVATKPAQRGGRFHGCGLNHVNRIGFVLGSRCRIANLHYVGIERARYPDSHPMCGGSPFQTPGCATPYCDHSQNASWLTFGGAPVRDSIVENITIAGGTTQNAFWMPENPAGMGHCVNITARNIAVLGTCEKPGPCCPPTSADGGTAGGGGTWADGVNIHGSHQRVLIEGNSIPHTGDDSFALWSKGATASDVTFRNNFAQSPRYPRSWLASCFAMYGGNQSAFLNNTCIQSGATIDLTVLSGQRGAIYLVNGFRGDFIKNVSFARVAGNCR